MPDGKAEPYRSVRRRSRDLHQSITCRSPEVLTTISDTVRMLRRTLPATWGSLLVLTNFQVRPTTFVCTVLRPQARLMGYKVCAGVGSCLSASTILAIEDAVSPFSLTMQSKPVAHVINLSLGGSGGPDDTTAVAASNAALMGTIVVASAGNSGPGEGTVGSPAAGRHVIAVGAQQRSRRWF